MEIFDLPNGHSERDIKRAYAKALKKIDVDENPEQFEQLHNAYKQALYEHEEQLNHELTSHENLTLDSHPENTANQDVIEAGIALDQSLSEDWGSSQQAQKAQAEEEHWPEQDSTGEQLATSEASPHYAEQNSIDENKLEQHYQQQLEAMDNKLELLLKQPKQCKKLYSWMFLNEFSELSDYDFWIDASQLTYDRIAFSQSPDNKEKRPDITEEVLMFLDSIFNWSEYLEDPQEPAYNHHQTLYNRIQGLQGLQVSSPAPVINSKPDTENNFHVVGLFALIIDYLVFFAAFSALKTLFSSTALQWLFHDLSMPVAALVYYIACIVSPMQGTFGQYFSNLMVETYNHTRPTFVDALRRSAGLGVLVIFSITANIYELDFSDQPVTLFIAALPVLVYSAWRLCKNTQLKERVPKNGILFKDTLRVSILALAIDSLVLIVLLVLIQEAFNFPAILALEGSHGPAIHLIYYLLFLASPLNGTIGHFALKVKVVSRSFGKPTLKDISRRSVGLLYFTALGYLTFLLPEQIQTQFQGLPAILLPATAYLIWMYFNKSHLVARSFQA